MDRIISAFNNSLTGFTKTFDKKRSFREDVIIFVLFFPVALFSHITPIEKTILIFSLIFILAAELINTLIEMITDEMSGQKHPLLKMAKDIGSSIVMLSLINAVLSWGVIFTG